MLFTVYIVGLLFWSQTIIMYIVCVFFKNCKAHPSDSNGWEGDEQVRCTSQDTQEQTNSPQCLMCSVGFRYSPQSQVWKNRLFTAQKRTFKNDFPQKKQIPSIFSCLFQPSPNEWLLHRFHPTKTKNGMPSFMDFGAGFSLGVAPCDLKLHKYCGVRTNQRLHQGHQSLVQIKKS